MSSVAELSQKLQTAKAAPLRAMTWILLIATILGACFLNYWQYSHDSHSEEFVTNPKNWVAVAQGWGYAPAQYRLGVVQSAAWIARHSPLQMRHIFGLYDLFAALASLLLLLSRVEKSVHYRGANLATQSLASAAFLLLTLYYLVWLCWFQRPETLSCTLYLTLSLGLWTRGRFPGSAGGKALLAVGLILLSLAQALIRADVAWAFNLGVFLICLLGRGKDLALRRWPALAVSFLGVVLAGAVQLFLMKSVYPHAVYPPDTPVVEFWLNLTSPQRWLPFAVFVLPFYWTLRRVTRTLSACNSADLSLQTGALIFFALWAVVAKIDEVRTVLPFSLALIPLTVQMLIERLGLTPATGN